MRTWHCLINVFCPYIESVSGSFVTQHKIAFVATNAILSYFVPIKNKVLLFISVLAVIMSTYLTMLVIFPDMKSDRMFSNKEEATGPVEMRKKNLGVGLKIFSEHPFIGSGPDGFILNYHRYTAQRHRALKTHNTPLQILLEYGLIGLTLFLAIFYLTAKIFFSLYKEMRISKYKLLNLTLLSAFAGYICFMITSNSLLDKHMWLLIGLSHALYYAHRNEKLNWRPFS